MSEVQTRDWRALGIRKDGTEHLICIGNTFDQVKKLYPFSFQELLTEDEQNDIVSISIDKWVGIPNRGNWVKQDSVRIPPVLRVAS